VQKYCGEESIPPEGVLLLERGWLTEEIVVIYMDCRGCKDKGVQIHENQEQKFLLETAKKHTVQSMPESIELKRRRSKERRNNKSRMYRVWKKRCNYEKGI